MKFFQIFHKTISPSTNIPHAYMPRFVSCKTGNLREFIGPDWSQLNVFQCVHACTRRRHARLTFLYIYLYEWWVPYTLLAIPSQVENYYRCLTKAKRRNWRENLKGVGGGNLAGMEWSGSTGMRQDSMGSKPTMSDNWLQSSLRSCCRWPPGPTD